MRVSKKQLKFIKLVERCKGLFRSEVNTQEYPSSMIDALVKKGLLAEYKNKPISTTSNNKP